LEEDDREAMARTRNQSSIPEEEEIKKVPETLLRR
jgi:hypothetical protein